MFPFHWWGTEAAQAEPGMTLKAQSVHYRQPVVRRRASLTGERRLIHSRVCKNPGFVLRSVIRMYFIIISLTLANTFTVAPPHALLPLPMLEHKLRTFFLPLPQVHFSLFSEDILKQGSAFFQTPRTYSCRFAKCSAWNLFILSWFPTHPTTTASSFPLLPIKNPIKAGGGRPETAP